MDRGDPKQIIKAPQVKIVERSEDRMLKLGAQYSLAACYDIGTGVEKVSVQAVAWYRKANFFRHAGAEKRIAALGLARRPAN